MSDFKAIKVKLDERLFLEAVCGAPAPKMSIDALKRIVRGYEGGEELLHRLEKCLKEGAGTMVVAYRNGEPVDVIPSCDEKGSVSFNEYWRLAQKLREKSLSEGEKQGIQKETDSKEQELLAESVEFIRRLPENDEIEITNNILENFKQITELKKRSRNNALQKGLAPQLIPLTEMGVKHSQGQSQKASKPRKSKEEITRDTRIVEDFKEKKAQTKGVYGVSTFAKEYCNKYNLGWRQVYSIIKENLPE